MTKKRLSDLLKEEVNKADTPAESAPEPEADAAQAEPEAKPAASKTTSRRASSASRRTSSSRQTGKPARSTRSTKTTGKTTSQKKNDTTAAKTTTPSTPKAKAESTATTTPAIASEAAATPDLAATVKTLEQDLAAAATEKTRLEKVVEGLQKDLDTQQARLFELKDSLDQAEATSKAKADALTKTQAELEDAKKTILQLTEANAKAPVPVKSTPTRRSGIDILPRRPVESASQKHYHRGVPETSVEKSQPNPMLSDADIGWVD